MTHYEKIIRFNNAGDATIKKDLEMVANAHNLSVNELITKLSRNTVQKFKKAPVCRAFQKYVIKVTLWVLIPSVVIIVLWGIFSKLIPLVPPESFVFSFLLVPIIGGWLVYKLYFDNNGIAKYITNRTGRKLLSLSDAEPKGVVKEIKTDHGYLYRIPIRFWKTTEFYYPDNGFMVRFTRRFFAIFES